jgi:hypothetical protein
MLFIVDPIPFRRQPFTGRDRWQRANHRDEVATALCLYFQDGEPIFIVEESDALDQSADRFDGFRSVWIDLFDAPELNDGFAKSNKFQPVAQTIRHGAGTWGAFLIANTPFAKEPQRCRFSFGSG